MVGSAKTNWSNNCKDFYKEDKAGIKIPLPGQGSLPLGPSRAHPKRDIWTQQVQVKSYRSGAVWVGQQQKVVPSPAAETGFRDRDRLDSDEGAGALFCRRLIPDRYC